MTDHDATTIDPAALDRVPTLETDRLRLEPEGPAHLAMVWRAVRDPDILRLTATRAAFTREQIAARLDHLQARPDRADWAIVRPADGAVMGEVVLNDLRREDRAMNVRILLTAEHQGRGYGTQAMRAVVDYGLGIVRLHRISLGVYAFNSRAIRAYEKAGFRREGVLRDALYWDGAWHDEIIMAILDSDPRPWRTAGNGRHINAGTIPCDRPR